MFWKLNPFLSVVPPYLLLTSQWWWFKDWGSTSSKCHNVFFSVTLWGRHTSLESLFPSPRQWCIFLTLPVSGLVPTWYNMATWTFRMFSCKYGLHVSISALDSDQGEDKKTYLKLHEETLVIQKMSFLCLCLSVLSLKHFIWGIGVFPSPQCWLTHLTFPNPWQGGMVIQWGVSRRSGCLGRSLIRSHVPGSL